MPLSNPVPSVAFTTPTCVKAWVNYPFRDAGDAATKVYHHKMQVLNTSYAPLSDDDTMTAATEKPSGSPFADDANAYYVGDQIQGQLDGGLVEFVRMFANIPASRVEPDGFYSYQRPGILDNGISQGKFDANWATGNSTSKSFTNSPEPRITLTIPSSPARDDIFEVGDAVVVYNANNWGLSYSGGTYSGPFAVGVILTKSTNAFTINQLQCASNGSGTTLDDVTSINTDNAATAYQLWLGLPARDAATKNVAAFRSYEYVKTNTPETIELDAAATLDISNNNNGESTSLLADFTTPSPSTVLDGIKDGNLQIENEIVRRWRGNIYEKVKITGKVPIYPNLRR